MGAQATTARGDGRPAAGGCGREDEPAGAGNQSARKDEPAGSDEPTGAGNESVREDDEPGEAGSGPRHLRGGPSGARACDRADVEHPAGPQPASVPVIIGAALVAVVLALGWFTRSTVTGSDGRLFEDLPVEDRSELQAGQAPEASDVADPGAGDADPRAGTAPSDASEGAGSRLGHPVWDRPDGTVNGAPASPEARAPGGLPEGAPGGTDGQGPTAGSSGTSLPSEGTAPGSSTTVASDAPATTTAPSDPGTEPPAGGGGSTSTTMPDRTTTTQPPTGLLGVVGQLLVNVVGVLAPGG